jgi:transposase
MRQTHVGGDKLFVDYAGDTVPVIIDRLTGEVRQAQIFVAVMGASNFTHVEATWTQGLADWIAAHTRAFAAIGGVPRLIVPDNAKVAVIKACLYEPQVNRTYAEMAAHYGAAVLPTRPRRPRDKTSVSYCTSFGLSRGDTIQPCWTWAAATTTLDDLQAWRDVPKPTSKTV